MLSGQIILRTGRLVLREFTLEDVDRLVDLDADPEVMRFISKGQPTARERIVGEILPRWLAYYGQPPPRGFWAAHLGEEGPFLGWFHLRPDRFSPAEMELGYRLGRRFWGRGYATEGARALIETGFRDWQVAKFSARTLVLNRASQRVMEKCGLRFEEAFVYPEQQLPGWTAEERRGVKYGLARP